MRRWFRVKYVSFLYWCVFSGWAPYPVANWAERKIATPWGSTRLERFLGER